MLKPRRHTDNAGGGKIWRRKYFYTRRTVQCHPQPAASVLRALVHLARPTSACCAEPSMIHGEEDPGGLLWRRQVRRHYGAGQVFPFGLRGMYSASESLSFEADIKTNTSVISRSE